MPERYPDDATLLTLTQDTVTGVEYIPTGKSPYYLEFRKLLQRLLLAAQRANDMRVYQDGDLTMGVRSGRCFVGNTAHQYAGITGLTVAASSTTHVWLDSAGTMQTGTSGLPSDRTTFIPLAQVVTDTTNITTITDLRGEAFLQAANTVALGLTATTTEINQALDGISANVDDVALSALCAGASSLADSLHGHKQFFQDIDAEAILRLINDNSGTSANMGLCLSLPNVLSYDSTLVVNRNNGFLQQQYNNVTYNLVGTVHRQFRHEGDLTSSLNNKVMGMVPINGTVSDVVLSVGTNIQSSTSTDGLDVAVKINGTTVTTTNPSITSADGAGFASTAQGDGAATVIKTDGTEDITQGDVLSVDLTRNAVGTVTTELADVVVMIVVRANQPE